MEPNLDLDKGNISWVSASLLSTNPSDVFNIGNI
jgi:hypothetical protein